MSPCLLTNFVTKDTTLQQTSITAVTLISVPEIQLTDINYYKLWAHNTGQNEVTVSHRK